MLKIIIFVLLSLTLFTPTAFGTEEISTQKIELKTNNSAYVEGDYITITGTIEKVIPGMPVTIQLFYGKSLIVIAQVDVSQDGEFTNTLYAGGDLWRNEGTYTIKANYGLNTETEMNINFFKKTSGTYMMNYEVKIPNGGTFDIPYTIKGGAVSLVTLEQKNLSVVIDILTNSDGVLDIKLARDDIDSMSNNGKDIDFIVLIYKNESPIPIQAQYEKVESNDSYRAISIPIEQGDGKIEIIGTHVVPEFGTIAMVVLAVAIASIIAVSAKSKLNIMPRI
jgi:predicted secreted protein with PEFG-CTERM motif